MGCKACERRRKAMLAKQAAKKARGQRAQAAAIGAILVATEAVGRVFNGEASDGNVQDRQDRQGNT